MYYIRRQGRIKGPLTREKLRHLRTERRLRMRDEVSESPDGPWVVLRDVRKSVLGSDAGPPEYDIGVFGDDVGAGAATDPQTADDSAGTGWREAVRDWIEGDSLFPDPWRAWKIVLGVVLLVALAAFTVLSFLAHGGH